jgi:hypothetical protein
VLQIAGKSYTVDAQVLNFYSDYGKAKADLIQAFAGGASVKAGLTDFTTATLPLIFGAEQTAQLVEQFAGDYSTIFYRITPFMQRRVMPEIRREIRTRKKQYTRYARW